MAEALPDHLVLFDGLCAVCDRTVQFLLDRDPDGRLHFAPLQGSTAAAIRARHPELDGVDSLVFVSARVDGEQVEVRSRAVLGMLVTLGGPWAVLRPLLWVPAFLLDPGYRLFAAVRYRVFGTRESCRIPRPEEIGRFLP